MIESLILSLIIKLYDWVKKKYPNGVIKNIAIIELDKLDESIDKTKLDELTARETKELIIKEIRKTTENVISALTKKKTKE